MVIVGVMVGVIDGVKDTVGVVVGVTVFVGVIVGVIVMVGVMVGVIDIVGVTEGVGGGITKLSWSTAINLTLFTFVDKNVYDV
jgi:hypothetical protein